MTTVVPTQPTQPSLPTLFRSTNVEGLDEIPSAILSNDNDNVLNESPIRPANETAQPETAEPTIQVQQEVLQLVEEDIAPPQRTVLENVRTEETLEFSHVKSGSIEENIIESIDTSKSKSPQQQSVVCLFDSTQMKQSDIRNMPSCKVLLT